MANWCIDDGHGGSDSGAVDGSRYEKTDNKRIGDKVRALLKYNGENVFSTRVNDEYVSLDKRCEIANVGKANYFISLHRNSFSNSANGLESYNYPRDTKGRGLATNIQNSILEKVPFTNRGIKEATFRVLVGTNMTAVLIELGFISNSGDNVLFDKHIDIIAEQIVRACLKEVGKTFKKPQPITPETPNTGKKVMYRVICGSFKDKANAEKRVKDIQAKTGYNSFLVAEVVNGVVMYRVSCGSFEVKNNAQNRAYEIYEKTKFDCFLVAVKV